MSPLARPRDCRATIKRLSVRIRWYHVPLVVSTFFICFYLVTLLTSLLVPPDVTFYGEAQTEFTSLPRRRGVEYP